MAYLDVQHLGKEFLHQNLHKQEKRTNSLAVLRDLTFSMQIGEFCCMVGPSGCGKSTLLRIVAGLLSPDSGDVLLDGKRIDGPGFDRGMVFQNFNLLPWRTAQANVEFGLEVRGIPRAERREIARQHLAQVGLQGFEHYYPTQLSGGMQQRVGLARALAIEPTLLLMDEPFGSLDAQTREAMQVELARLWALHKRTTLLVTHDIEEALFLADTILVMTARPGRIHEAIPVSFPHPREESLRNSPEFAEARGYVSNALKSAVKTSTSA
jgi:NitT/TauT family transport system ATP-binding protein